MGMTERQEKVQRWKRLCSFAECATSAAALRDGVAVSPDNPCDVNPLYAERRLMEAAYEFASVARQMLYETPDINAHVRERANELCSKTAQVVSAFEIEASWQRDLKEQKENAK